MSTLKILTLNTWNSEGPYEARWELIKAEIDRHSPDVVALQEVAFFRGVSQLPNLLPSHLCHTAEVAITPLDEVGHRRFGNAIASRWPIEDQEVLALPILGESSPRAALSVAVASPFGKLSVTCTHLDKRLDGTSTRVQQALAIDSLISRRSVSSRLPPILAGDFNAEPEAEEIRFLMGLQAIGKRTTCYFEALRMCGQGPSLTWSNKNPYARQVGEPDRRLDYIFVGPCGPSRIGWPSSCKVILDQPYGDGLWASDHFGLVATIEV